MFRARALLVVAVIGVAACGSKDTDRLSADAAATSFELLAGGNATLAERLDQPMVVNFFAKWCKPCVAEMPDLEAVHQHYGDRVRFLGISTQENVESAQEIVALTGVTYEIGRDPAGGLLTAVGGLGMPTTLVVRGDGTIAHRRTGVISAEELREIVDSVVS
jgi:cytochrome c biogenesis protein CcmG, thiol:disulfide interchange protein DsbE